MSAVDDEYEDGLTRWRATAQARQARQQACDVPADIVRKVFVDGQPAGAEPVPMDAITQQRWNEWADARIMAMLAEFSEMIGGEVRAVVAPLQTEINELKRQLAKRKRGR